MSALVRVDDRLAFSAVSLALICTVCLLGCAESPPEALDADSAPEADTSRASLDASTDAVEEGDITSEADGGGDVGCTGVCCPGSATCLDMTTRRVCNASGSGYETETCMGEKICKDGKCADKPVCTPGDRTCHNDSTALVCRPSGTSRRTENCDSGETCIDGNCVSGSPNGADCSKDGDCAGGTCRCGTESTGICATKPGRGLCTRKCGSQTCDDGEFCLSASVFPEAGYDHCVKECKSACASSGLECVALPVANPSGKAWKKGCYFEATTPIGKPCKSNEPCVGGKCLTNYFPSDICTKSCKGDCPAGSACVELRSGQFYCTPLCGDGSLKTTEPCPLEKGMDRNDIVCASRSIHGGGVKTVCDKPD